MTEKIPGQRDVGRLKRYVRRAGAVDAVQLVNDRERIAACIEWACDLDMSTSIIGRNACISRVLRVGGLEFNSIFGPAIAHFGDYIVRSEQGFFAYPQDVFWARFADVQEEEHGNGKDTSLEG